MTKKYAVKIVGGMGTIGAICHKGFDFNGTWFDSKKDAEEFKGMLEYINKNAVYEIIEEVENMSNLEYAVQVVTSTDGSEGVICVGDDRETEFWTDSCIEAQQFKIEKESVHGWQATYKIISREKKNVTEPLEQASEHRHPHADMIIEWAKDTSKVVEYWADEMSLHPVSAWKVTDNPTWVKSLKYRFQPAKQERVFPTTSLTEDELVSIYFDAPVLSSKESYKYIANAAIKQYILDMEKANDK